MSVDFWVYNEKFCPVRGAEVIDKEGNHHKHCLFKVIRKFDLREMFIFLCAKKESNSNLLKAVTDIAKEVGQSIPLNKTQDEN